MQTLDLTPLRSPPIRSSAPRSNGVPFTLGRALLPALALAVAAAGSAGSADAAGLLIADGGNGGILKIQSQDVRVTINNGVAVTQVEQTFLNTEQRIVEALYTFPVPNKASVSNFSMWINGREMVGEVVEKKRAREIYDSYKRVRRDPGLLEQVDYKRFEMRIFPIPAGAEQRVQVTYYQELDFDDDTATYVYPLATVADRGADSRTTGRFSLTLELKSETPIVELASPSHDKQFAIVKRDDVGYYTAALEVKEGELNRDIVLNYQLSRPQTGIDLVTSRTSGEDGYFMLTMTAGKELEGADTGSDYVFLLDVSGSMGDDGKLRASQSSIAAFIEALGVKDRFDVITFNIAANPLFTKLTTPSDDARKQVREFLSSQRAVGGTRLRPALEAAYRYVDKDRPLNVVILSDGMTEQQEQRQLIEMIAQKPGRSTVFCVGVGNEVNRPLLSQLAENAGGLAAFVSQGDDFQRQAAAFRRKLTRPAAKNVQIELAGADTYDVEPRELPNLYHGQPLRIYGRYRKAGPAQMRLRAEVLGQPIDQAQEVTLPAEDATNPEIERMWASHVVERMMAEHRRSGSQSNANEIVRLCEGYSIAGEYASFIVLENDGEYQRWKIDRRNAVRIQRDRTAQQNLREQLDRLRDTADRNIGPSGAEQLAQVQVDVKSSVPQRQTTATPGAGATPQVAPDSAPAPQRRRGNGFDLNLPRGGGGGGGGGAIDPLTAIGILTTLGLGLGARKRRRAA